MKRVKTLCACPGCEHGYQCQQGADQEPRSAKAATNFGNLKFFDSVASETQIAVLASTGVGVTPFAPVSTASACVLNQVPQGNLESQRVGRSIANRSLRVRGVYETDGTTAGSMTIFIVWDRSPTKAAAMPAWTTIFQNQSTVTLLALNAMGRFIILHTEDIKAVLLSSTAGSTGVDRQFDFTVDLHEWSTLFGVSSASGEVTNMVTGALYLYSVANVPPTWAPGRCTVVTRLTYSDE